MRCECSGAVSGPSHGRAQQFSPPAVDLPATLTVAVEDDSWGCHWGISMVSQAVDALNLGISNWWYPNFNLGYHSAGCTVLMTVDNH